MFCTFGALILSLLIAFDTLLILDCSIFDMDVVPFGILKLILHRPVVFGKEFLCLFIADASFHGELINQFDQIHFFFFRCALFLHPMKDSYNHHWHSLQYSRTSIGLMWSIGLVCSVSGTSPVFRNTLYGNQSTLVKLCFVAHSMITDSL